MSHVSLPRGGRVVRRQLLLCPQLAFCCLHTVFIGLPIPGFLMNTHRSYAVFCDLLFSAEHCGYKVHPRL